MIDCGEPANTVWAFPAESATEKLAADASDETRAEPPGGAVEVAVTVHTVDEVWTMLVIAEMFVNAKSCPATVESVVQSIASFPVMVNEIDVVDDVAAVRASVTVGGVESVTVTTKVAVIDAPSASLAVSEIVLLPV